MNLFKRDKKEIKEITSEKDDVEVINVTDLTKGQGQFLFKMVVLIRVLVGIKGTIAGGIGTIGGLLFSYFVL